MAKRSSATFIESEAAEIPVSAKKTRLTVSSVTKDLIRWKIENLFVESGNNVIEVNRYLYSIFDQ